MAKHSGLTNKDQVRVATIECVKLDTPLDEKDPRHYHGADMNKGEMWPYHKTMSGALQCSTMPWDHNRYQKGWGFAGTTSFIIALLAKIH